MWPASLVAARRAGTGKTMIRLLVSDEHRQSRTLSAGSIREGARVSAGASRKRRLRVDAQNPGYSEPSGRWVSGSASDAKRRMCVRVLPAPNHLLQCQDVIGRRQPVPIDGLVGALRTMPCARDCPRGATCRAAGARPREGGSDRLIKDLKRKARALSGPVATPPSAPRRPRMLVSI